MITDDTLEQRWRSRRTQADKLSQVTSGVETI